MQQFDLSRRLAAEAIGTAGLLAVVVGSGIMGESLAGGNVAIALLGNTIATGAILVGSGIMAESQAGGNVAIALLGNTIATGAILVVLIFAFGPLSGAHFNPAVTLSFLMRREIAPGDALLYVLAQIAGGLMGALTAHAMFELPLIQISETARSGPAQWFAEWLATFGLVATILATLRFRPDAVAPAVGLYITAGYWFTASTSFANPAVTVARSFTDTFSGIAPGHAPAFILAQLIGAASATLVFAWLLFPPRAEEQAVAESAG